MNKHHRDILVHEFQRGELEHIVFWSPFGCFVRRTWTERVELV